MRGACSDLVSYVLSPARVAVDISLNRSSYTPVFIYITPADNRGVYLVMSLMDMLLSITYIKNLYKMIVYL